GDACVYPCDEREASCADLVIGRLISGASAAHPFTPSADLVQGCPRRGGEWGISSESRRIVDKAWNFATVLWHDGVPVLAATEVITFLLFLKMADEQTRPPYNRPPIVPPELGWPSLLSREGEELKRHYDRVLAELARKPGMLGDIFRRARSAIEKPETLRRL